jgi:PPOX class probable F420-dependent enzyme
VDAAEARRRFAGARVARLATVGPGGRPHLVPVVFAVSGDTVVSAVDDVKPKSTQRLRRVANAAAHPQVCLLADFYDDDWGRLWWVRADGRARVLDPAAPEAEAARSLLSARYRQYAERPPGGPVVSVSVEKWTGWAARPPGGPAR